MFQRLVTMLLGACEINTGAVRAALNKLAATLDSHTNVQPDNETMLLETSNTMQGSKLTDLKSLQISKGGVFQLKNFTKD